MTCATISSAVQRLNMSFFIARVGSVISRITSDVEAVRAGVQDVVFITLVGLGQMLAAAGLMLWYDPVLFLVVAAIGPVLGLLNYRFRGRLSRAIAPCKTASAASRRGWSRPCTAC